MLKGAQKRIIVVKTSESKLFEEALFVVRREVSEFAGERDMVEEANRIIDGVTKNRRISESGAKGFIKGLACFICGAGLSGLLFFVFLLL